MGTADGQGVDGTRAIRVHVPFTFDPDVGRGVIPSLYQQYEPDWKFRVRGKVQANKYIWTSEEITVDSKLKKYELEYEHAVQSVRNVRFSFIFIDRHSEIVLDQIELRGRRPE